MDGNPSDGAASGDTDSAPEDLERKQSKREMLNLLTQDTRFTLIQNILAHPRQLPSLKELDYYNPSKSKSTIRNHLDTLIEKGLVEVRKLPEDDRARNLPWKFYGLTDTTVSLLRDAGLIEAEDTLQEMYELLELTEEIERYAEAPRPEEGDDPSLEDFVHEAKSNTQSVDDQIAIVRSMFDEGIGPDHDGLTRSELKDVLSVDPTFRMRTSLNHLEDMHLVDSVKPAGPSVFVISERLDEIINGRVEEVAADDLENLIAHMEDELYSVDIEDIEKGEVVAITDGSGTTIRSVLASEFDIDLDEVVSYLREGDEVEKLNAAVDAIESNDRVSSPSDYGKIVFRRPANRYRLTSKAVNLIEGSR